MSIYYDAPILPDALTVFVRQVPLPTGNALSQMMPVKYLDTNMVDFLEIVKVNRTAHYRAFDGSISVSSRDSGSDKRVPLAPLSSALNSSEYERLQREFARLGGTMKELLEQAIYNDGQQLVGEIRNRMELAWGDVFNDGILTINENGLQASADYGVAGNHKVTAGTLWSDLTNSTPFSDVMAWNDQWVLDNGTGADEMLTSLRVIRYLQQNKQLLNMIYGANIGRTWVELGDINSLFAQNGLPTLRPHYDTQLSVDGTYTRVLPDNKVILLPADKSELGFTAYGVSATALELVNSNSSDFTFQDAPGIVGVVIKEGPPFREFVFVDAVGQPVIANARKIMIATVAS